MSASGPDPARLNELRRRFEDAACEFPNVSAIVVYRPALRLNPGGGEVIDCSDPFLRSFLQANGELTPNVWCLTATVLQYSYVTIQRGPSDQVDYGWMVWESMMDDPRAERPRWWSDVIFRGDHQYQRLDMLARDAARLVLRDTGRSGTPPADWLIHLASQPELPAHRGVMISSGLRTAATPTWVGVRFDDCPSKLRQNVSRSASPSWWVVGLDNVFRRSRDAIEQTLAALEVEAGRPRNKDTEKMIARILELKAAGEKWRVIYTKINDEFGTNYDYSRGGSLHKLVQGHR